MKHAKSIAMARSLIAEGRTVEVIPMIEPLLEHSDPSADAEGYVMLRVLLARVKLLRYGDVPGALAQLKAWRTLSQREALTATARAEVSLWLGWALSWAHGEHNDTAYALALFDEARATFANEIDPAGICWTHLGKARAYRLLEEFEVMEQQLEEAHTLQHKLQDALAAHWLLDLRITQAHYRGGYPTALRHAEALLELGRNHHIPLTIGRAHALKALLLYSMGRNLESVRQEAQEAVHLLENEVVVPGLLLADAHRVYALALIRQGQPKQARSHIRDATDHLAVDRLAADFLQLVRVELAIRQENFDKAQEVLTTLVRHTAALQHRRLGARVALLQSVVFLAQQHQERAAEWAERAHQQARESYHAGLQLETQLHRVVCAVAAGHITQAQELMQQAELQGELLSTLPYTALRFATHGHLAEAAGNNAEAAALYAQALTAYGLIGDRYEEARMQAALARQQRAAEPAAASALASTAAATFATLGADRRADEARALVATMPESTDSQADEALSENLGAVLARAAVSAELVAEAWMQAIRAVNPEGWMGLFRQDEIDGWQAVTTHGDAPNPLLLPTPNETTAVLGDVHWQRLPSSGVDRYTFGFQADQGSLLATTKRVENWLPVVALALDHALLRANRVDGRSAADRTDGDEPDVPLVDFVYGSTRMRNVVKQIHRIRASHSPVLVTGESGTGKELVARAVHRTSERRDHSFIPFNCTTVPRDLFDSHLFGHERGAFTGANRAHPGVIRAADGGTLFLDEIGDLPLDVQPKLLRFLQEGEVFPLGAKKPLRVNVRVIAATNQRLEEAVREGRFREDLYYRLNVIPLRVPPLRERRDEIPLLVRHFLHDMQPKGAPVPTITNRAMDALLRYNWPGNIRQLRNEIERVLVFVGSEPNPLIDVPDLSPAVTAALSDQPSSDLNVAAEQILYGGHTLDEMLAEAERALIERVLQETTGQVTAAADILGLTRQGLYKKIKRLGIDIARLQEASAATSTGAFMHMN